METYKKTVWFTVGLAVMILVGALNALLMTPKSDWFCGLRGMYIDGRAHSIGWLVVYILIAVHIGGMASNRRLRRHLPSLGLLIACGTAWCGVFFRLHSMAGAVALLLACAVFAGRLFAAASKETRRLAFFSAPVFSWYLYLFVVNVFLAITNGIA